MVPDVIFVSEAGMERLTKEPIISAIGVDIKNFNDLERIDSELQAINSTLTTSEWQLKSSVNQKELYNQMNYSLSLLGNGAAILLIVIGLINFVNVMLTGVVARKNEFAIMESIGTTKKQIRKILTLEGGIYALISTLLIMTFGNAFLMLVADAVPHMANYAVFKYPVALVIGLIAAFLQFCILRKVVRFAAMANIFLLEDDKILSKGISIALKKDEHMVTAVYGYLEALKQYQKQKYDLFLLDINLPDGNGLEFCEKIRETSETPVLFLTANDTEEDMLEGFGVGCDDYISKPFSIEVLRKKVLAVLKRSGVGKFRMKYRDLELDKEKCLVLMKGQEIHLTSTEYKLLLYLMENRGRVVTKAMLLEQLWDIDGNFVDDNTVRVNIKRLRQKLNDEKQEYIVTVFGMGYSFGE